MSVSGPVFAIITPFTANLDVDYGALGDYLRFLSEHGVRSIVVNGTTAEFASLTTEERMAVLEHCRKLYGRTIVCHVSSCSYRECHMLVDHARDHADAVLLLPPFYYANVAEAGALLFMRQVVSYSRLPVYLYNFPEHTQFSIKADLLRTLADENGNLVGIKDSGGDLRVSQGYKQTCPRLQVFVGSDRGALEVLTMGLDGSVTGCGNPVPEFLVNLRAKFASGNRQSASELQQAFDVWTSFREGVQMGDLSVVKAALGARIPGFPLYVRPPFVTADGSSIELIRGTLRDRILPLVRGIA